MFISTGMVIRIMIFKDWKLYTYVREKIFQKRECDIIAELRNWCLRLGFLK